VSPERLHRVERLLKAVDLQLAQDWRRVTSDALPKARRTEPARTAASFPSNAPPKGAAPTGQAKDTTHQTKTSGWRFSLRRRRK